ncbi:hypothetical protein MNBD_GAMMA09-1783 [hydrothermal vent metagenome]|uniref:Uncharacterized protein n=1 Tax=hydrothermal vent metagenome TaxID=652676 RepID=A0A3B0XVH0_9ZZZZ
MKLAILQLQKIIFVLCLSGILPVFAQSERAWPIITFTCDKAKNEMKLKNEVKWGVIGKNFNFNKSKGLYNPWDLVKIEERGKYKLVSEKKQLKLKCKLARAEYTLVVKPKIFNPSFAGKCGDRLSVKVSVYKGKAILIEDKDMEKFCHGNAPVMRGIKVTDANSKVKLYEVSRSRFY